MLPHISRRLRALGLTIASLALLAFAPGAFAATLSVDGSGNLVYSAAAGHVNAVEFDQTGTTSTVVVHEVVTSRTYDFNPFFDIGTFADDDPITAGTNCSGDVDGTPGQDTDGNGDPIFTCTGVTGQVQATALDGNDAIDASGNFSDDGGSGLATLPLIADLGTGDDSSIGGAVNDVIHGGDGNDNVAGDVAGAFGGGGAGGDDQVFGEGGDDNVSGGVGNDLVDGGAGNDTNLTGGPGTDTINGGDGNDGFMAGGPGNDTIDGGAGDDSIWGECNGGCGTGGNTGNDTLNGGDGNDDVHGEQGNDVVNGGNGDDFAPGGQGNDAVDGGAGDDAVLGASGDDTVNGSAGDDYVTGGCGGYQSCGAGTDGNDAVNGGAGQDFLDGDAGTDTMDGGTGIDQVGYPSPASVTLDGQANDGLAGENDNVVNVEDVQIAGGTPGTPGSSITGDAGVNSLSGGGGNDVISGGDGNDFLFGNAGDDTLNANDGFADRVVCGTGNDVANVDEFDQVADDCETVNRTTRGGLATEDAPPTVAWVTPASGATMSASAANTLQVNATDDHGISQVIFMAGERVVCTDTTAPYTCAYRPTGDDVGKVTLSAIAVDTRQQQASALRTVKVGRFKPRKLSASSSPKKDASAPFTFTTKGTLSLPTGVSKSVGCNGKVSVTFKAGGKTISTRRTSLKKTCRYTSKVTFRLPSRLHPSKLKVVVRFLGNAVLTAKNASAYSVKTA